VARRDVSGIAEQLRRFVDLIAQHICLTEINNRHSLFTALRDAAPDTASPGGDPP
jgi:predicted short-subunit dehydrogenase-like oxidoreductase (DUF2520 family)